MGSERKRLETPFFSDLLDSLDSSIEGTTQLISPSHLFNFLRKDKKALKQEFERIAIPHLSNIYTSAFYLTKDEHEAEDLAQETYVRAYRFFDKFERGTNCRAWLLAIQRRLFINRYRRRKREPEFVNWERIDQEYEAMVIPQDQTEKYNPEILFGARHMGPEVEKALTQLPEEFRTAVILIDIEELSYEEAARVMQCPLGTVRSRLSRARRLLQVALKDYVSKRGMKKSEL